MHSRYEWLGFMKKYENWFIFAYRAVIILEIFRVKMKENALYFYLEGGFLEYSTCQVV